ncbi:MAG: hypothetical protein V1736_06855 [Pseudomonadota bacterium]
MKRLLLACSLALCLALLMPGIGGTVQSEGDFSPGGFRIVGNDHTHEYPFTVIRSPLSVRTRKAFFPQKVTVIAYSVSVSSPWRQKTGNQRSGAKYYLKGARNVFSVNGQRSTVNSYTRDTSTGQTDIEESDEPRPSDAELDEEELPPDEEDTPPAEAENE